MAKLIIKLLVRIAPLHFLIASISVLNWDVYLNVDEESDIVKGLIIGHPEFVERMASKDNENDDSKELP